MRARSPSLFSFSKRPPTVINLSGRDNEDVVPYIDAGTYSVSEGRPRNQQQTVVKGDIAWQGDGFGKMAGQDSVYGFN